MILGPKSVQKISIVFATMAGLTSCQAHEQNGERPTGQTHGKCTHKIQSGRISWYGEEMAVGRKNGKRIYNRTASGERFVPGGISAAHKTLPLGSRIRVEVNGRSLIVEVNDRGPYAGSRILDLSRGAAEKLKVKRQGVVRGTIYRCQP